MRPGHSRRANCPSTRFIVNAQPGQVTRPHLLGMTGLGALRPPEMGPFGQAKDWLARRATTTNGFDLYFRTAPQVRRRCACVNCLFQSQHIQTVQLYNNVLSRIGQWFFSALLSGFLHFPSTMEPLAELARPARQAQASARGGKRWRESPRFPINKRLSPRAARVARGWRNWQTRQV